MLHWLLIHVVRGVRELIVIHVPLGLELTELVELVLLSLRIEILLHLRPTTTLVVWLHTLETELLLCLVWELLIWELVSALQILIWNLLTWHKASIVWLLTIWLHHWLLLLLLLSILILHGLLLLLLLELLILLLGLLLLLLVKISSCHWILIKLLLLLKIVIILHHRWLVLILSSSHIHVSRILISNLA